MKNTNKMISGMVLMTLAGCQSATTRRDASNAGDFKLAPTGHAQLKLEAAIPKDKLNTASRQLAAEGIKALDAKNYEKANALFNLALKVDINNSYLHFFNAIAYHMRGLGGEGALYSLAFQGYTRAIEFDPSNIMARHQLGLLYMDRHNYKMAMQELMEASLYSSTDTDLLYDLIVAAYYAKDARVAYAALEGLRALEHQDYSERTLKAAAIVAASAGETELANTYIAQLREKKVSPERINFIEKRVRDWQNSLKNAMMITSQVKARSGNVALNDAKFKSTPILPNPLIANNDAGWLKNLGVIDKPSVFAANQSYQVAGYYGAPPANMNSGGGIGQPVGQPMGQPMNSSPGMPQSAYGQPQNGMSQPYGYGGGNAYGSPMGMNQGYGAGGFGQGNGFYDKRMVMLDVAIVATEEDVNDTFGVNLLDGLRIQFGNSLGTPAISRTINQTNDLLNNVVTSKVETISKVVSIPAISYSLNIANAQERRNEVVARPTLAALGGQTSTFFSGTEIVGAAVSNGQGGSVQVQKEAGVKLAVTPEFLPDNYIKIRVEAERTFLTNPNSNVLFDFRLDTSKTLVNANVVLKYGETLILSGLAERNIETGNSGVPLLRDVPIVQYLFNRKTKRDFNKSVLIFITPRRPAYTNRDEKDIQEENEKLTEFEKMQKEFEGKFKLWFKPVPNLASTLNVLDTSPIFREFRSGDIEVESWSSRDSHFGRLKNALNFLYF